MRDLAFFALGFFTATAITTYIAIKLPRWANEAIEELDAEARAWEKSHD